MNSDLMIMHESDLRSHDHADSSEFFTACGPRGPRPADDVSGQLPRRACRRLARRYVVRVSGGRWRRTQHAGGPTRPELGACPSRARQGLVPAGICGAPKPLTDNIETHP